MAAAVRTKRPAPMMAPMPRAIRDVGPSVRFSSPSEVKLSIGLVLNNELDAGLPELLACVAIRFVLLC